MDERVIVDAGTGERFLLPVDEETGRAAVCLVEPWACVEQSYASRERQTIQAGGRLLVVADAGWDVLGLADALRPEGDTRGVDALCHELLPGRGLF